MKSLNILHVVSTSSMSGAEKVVFDISQYLVVKGHQSFVLCSGDPLAAQYKNAGFEVIIWNIKDRLTNQLIKHLSMLNIHIIHGHDVKSSIFALKISRKLNIPVVSHVHGFYTWMKNMTIKRLADSYFRNKYSLTLFCTKSVENYYNKRKKVQNAITIENSLNFIENNDRKKKLIDLSNKWNKNKSSFFIGFVGRIVNFKGVDLIIEGFEIFLNKNPEARLFFIGDGCDIQFFKNKVKSKNLENFVFFEGFQEDVYQYLNIFDCFVLASYHEGLPISILEAISFQVPIISTPVAGIKDVIIDNHSGLLLKSREPQELYEKFNILFKDPLLSLKLAENALNILQSNHHMEKYIKILLKEYYKLLA